jgi:hypothetical protein
MKAEEFIKTKNSFDWQQTPSAQFKLKRFQGIDSKIDNKR